MVAPQIRVIRTRELETAVLIANEAMQAMIRATQVRNLRLPKAIPQIVIASEGEEALAEKLFRAAQRPGSMRRFVALSKGTTLDKLAEATRLVKHLRPSGAKPGCVVPWKPKHLELQCIRSAFSRLYAEAQAHAAAKRQMSRSTTRRSVAKKPLPRGAK